MRLTSMARPFIPVLFGFLAFGGLFPIQPPVSASAVQQTPVSLREIRMFDSQNGWAIGGDEGTYDCHVLRTSRGDKRWQDVSPKLTAPPQVDVFSQCIAATFLDMNIAWVIYPGENALWHSADGGQTWNSFPLQVDQYFAPQSLQFVDDQHGWFLTRYDVQRNDDWGLYQTSDGGASWEVIANLGLEADYTGMAFFDAQTGWLTASYQGGPAILMTQDGGLSWNAVTPSPDAPNAIDVPNCAFFQPVILSANSIALPALCLVHDPGNVEKTSTDAYLLQTSDGGQSWTASLVANGNWSWDDVRAPQLQMLDSDIGWMTLFDLDSANDDLFRTADGGQSWTRLPFAPLPTNYQFDFVDSRTGWAASGSLMRTNDGGRSWSPVNPIIR